MTTIEFIFFNFQAIKVTPLVWIFLAIISVLVLMIVLIGLILRARCSKNNRHKAKFVRATEQNTLLKERTIIVRDIRVTFMEDHIP